jgi:hypothetical protein
MYQRVISIADISRGPLPVPKPSEQETQLFLTQVDQK